MQDEELRRLRELLDEVESWLRRGELLKGFRDQGEPPAFEHYRKTLAVKIAPAEQLNELCRDEEEDASPWSAVTEKWEWIEETYYTVGFDTPETLRECFRAKCDKIEALLQTEERQVEFGYRLCQYNGKRKRPNREWVESVVFSCI